MTTDRLARLGNASPTTAGMVRCAVAAVLFGSTVPVASRLVDQTSPQLVAGLLYIGAALAVLPIVLRKAHPITQLQRGGRALGTAVVAGGLLGPLLLTSGLARTPAATASLLLNLEVVATVVISAVVFREHLGGRVVAGVGLVTVAGVLLTWSGSPEPLVGALLIAAACLCWGVDNSVTAHLDSLAPEHITLAKGAIAGTTNVALALVIGAEAPGILVVVAALATGAVGYGASITLWVAGARDIGAARGQLVFSLAPFIGATAAWVVLGDPASPTQVTALGVALAGALLVVGSGHEHAHSHEAIDHVHKHVHDAHHQHEHTAGDLHEPHTHRHEHEPLAHAHPHVPDLHHRHDH